jgi:hypothetical protein
MDSTNNDFVDMLGEHTRERATERASGCSPRELLWVDIFLRTNSVIKANEAAGYAGHDKPESQTIKRELIKRQSILINRFVACSPGSTGRPRSDNESAISVRFSRRA